MKTSIFCCFFISIFSFGQTTTYEVKKRNNPYSNQSTYEVTKKNDISTQMYNHAKNLNEIRNRVQNEINSAISDGQQAVLNLNPKNNNIYTSKILFSAREKAF